MAQTSSFSLSLFLCALFPAAHCLAQTTPERKDNSEYQIILWMGDSMSRHPEKMPSALEQMRHAGITAAMAGAEGECRAFAQAQMPYYVENIVNRGLCLKWNSSVRDWDGFIRRWMKEGRTADAFVRDYCLNDPQWLENACQQMRAAVCHHHQNSPLLYNIRDELSTTISANPFDYDYHPLALAAFQKWLRERYGTLAALNAEWETDFPAWEKVTPFSTDQIKARMTGSTQYPPGAPDWRALQSLRFDPATAHADPTRWNFSPWCDFRTFMDISLASALDALRGAAHEIDPQAPVGIEGTQAPSAFGGYDLWRLSQALDWVEPYDIGSAREMLGSFMPGKTFVTTLFEKEANPVRRRLWHLLLEGDRGCILWWSEDCLRWNGGDWTLTDKARTLEPVLREMRSPLARLFLNAKKESDPIFLLYAHPSVQVAWLLESTVDGATWPRRFSSFEAQHSLAMQRRESWLKALQDLGFSPQFLAEDQLPILKPGSTLICCDALALSDAALEKMSAHQRANGLVLQDTQPAGAFDSHGKLHAQKPPAFTSIGADISRYAAERLKPSPDLELLRRISDHLSGDVAPEVSLPPEARVRIHRYRLGAARLIAFERNISWQMSEDLRQAGGNAALEKPIALQAQLRAPAHIYDLRTQSYLGFRDRIPFSLDPWQPALFALLPEKTDPKNLLPWLLQQAQ